MIYGKGLQIFQIGGSSILFCCFASPMLHCVYKNIVIFAGSIEVKTVDPQLWVSSRRNFKWPCYLEAEFNFPSILTCIYFHLCACVYAFTSVCVWSGGQRSTPGVFQDHFSSYVLRQVSQLNPGVTSSSTDALTLPLMGLHVDHRACQAVLWVLGIRTLVLILWG